MRVRVLVVLFFVRSSVVFPVSRFFSLSLPFGSFVVVSAAFSVIFVPSALSRSVTFVSRQSSRRLMCAETPSSGLTYAAATPRQWHESVSQGQYYNKCNGCLSLYLPVVRVHPCRVLFFCFPRLANVCSHCCCFRRVFNVVSYLSL